MRKIDNYFNDIPPSLRPQTLIDNGIIGRILLTKRVDKNDYKGKNKDVKNSLLTKFHHCCAFCERRIGDYAPIEHFRPKHEITGVNTEGYYWLGVEWSNLVIACSDCNSSYKKNNFPILGLGKTLPQYTDLNDFFSKINIELLQDEQPLLLHPVLDNPDDYLFFEENGTVSAINNALKGSESIRFYGLSQPTKRIILIKDRKEIVDRVKNKLYHFVENYRDDESFYVHIENLIVTLIVDSQKNYPHSAVRRSCLSNFKPFFIDKFEGIDKQRLELAYQRVVAAQ